MKTYLGLGTGPGVGYETAAEFARQGFDVVLVARRADTVNPLAQRINAAGYRAQARTVDVTDIDSVASLIRDIEQEREGIDVLHYNVASLRQASIEQLRREDISSDLLANVGGAVAAVQAAAGQMLARRQGAVLITGGGLGLYPHPDYLTLSIGKAAIRALALALFEPFKAQGVHVATVTIAKFIDANSPDTKAVASLFWQMYQQPQEAWTAETVYGT
ncbi:SDR family NAD(P)-dependent oxidoreductase [Bordetella holmesii]|uniref:SDR family NAD(P)-dependent oxidoreductase n=1 Tax=Bordetella holmesii TaxID=35814 RepID=UPI0012986D53|nr:SDR family NAD(P)-dependent oxidoreductase [Bordetella holmesii]QGB64199.1 SDR family NAD(P)-dependent oxidoreductase [Bordetella holmesii]